MDLKDIIKILWIVCASGILFVLPSTIYTAMFLGIFGRQRALCLDRDDLKGTSYYPHREELKRVVGEAKQIAHTEVTVSSDDGLRLVGRYYDQHSDTTLLLVHGYQSNSFNNFSTLLKFFLSLGFNVLMVDQRAHGRSRGRFTTTGCKEQYDLLRWISHLEENSGCKNIFIYGVSMGATTIGLASDKIQSEKVKGLIMEAGFTSFYEELMACMGKVFMKRAAVNYILLCTKHLLKIDIQKSTEESLARTSIPVLFLHGDQDTDVSLTHTEKNFHACASEKRLVVVEGASHTLCHLMGKEKVENILREFIMRYHF